MKCNVCKAEMELWQTTKAAGQLVKRFRCVCGNEQAEIIGEERKPKPKEQED